MDLPVIILCISDTSGEAEEQLAIDCDVNELDVELDNKSKKLKLTARNVKSIINVSRTCVKLCGTEMIQLR